MGAFERRRYPPGTEDEWRRASKPAFSRNPGVGQPLAGGSFVGTGRSGTNKFWILTKILWTAGTGWSALLKPCFADRTCLISGCQQVNPIRNVPLIVTVLKILSIEKIKILLFIFRLLDISWKFFKAIGIQHEPLFPKLKLFITLFITGNDIVLVLSKQHRPYTTFFQNMIFRFVWISLKLIKSLSFSRFAGW